MSNTKQTELWTAIQRDAKAAKLTDGEYLAKNPARYEAYVQAGARTSPLHNNPAQRVISEEAQHTAQSKGISEAAALVDLFSRDAAGRERYAAWAKERDARLNPQARGAAGTKTGPLTTAEMLKLQQEGQRLGYSLSIADIADSGWVAARQLMQDLAEEAADMAGDDDAADGESYGELVTFSDIPH